MDKEHSLKGYLKRQSTEKLIQILAMYRDEKILVEADDMTAWMEEILKKRNEVVALDSSQ